MLHTIIENIFAFTISFLFLMFTVFICEIIDKNDKPHN